MKKKGISLCMNFYRKNMLKCLAFLICMGIALNVSAQTISVQGTVTDALGKPMPGVNVVVKGTTVGSITDPDGKYRISVINEDAILSFSFIGYQTSDVIVGNQTMVNTVMDEDALKLDEVVVIGYGTAKKRDLTGSIVRVRTEDIANKPASNPLASIQGKIAGVQVVNVGRAGQDPEIRIRGTNSINGYTPLYVVDGLFSDNINYLNPADIESMEILKDPSSLAIFGVRGANGVIIVSTKRAKTGQTLVNVNTSIGWKHVSDRISLTNAAQFKELYNEQLMNQKANPFDYSYYNADTDWQDEYFQTGFINNNNISITGATDKNRFYLGLGYTSEEGSIKTEKYEKITLNASSDYDVNDYIRFGFQLNGSRTLPPDAKDVDLAIKAAPIAPTHDPTTGMLVIMPTFQSQQVWNPLINTEIRGRHNLGTNHRAAGNIYGEVSFLKHFKFNATYSLDFSSDEARSFSPIVSVYDPYLSGISNLNSSESTSQNKLTKLTAQQDYILTYDNRFGDHSITATAAFTTNFVSYSKLEAGRSQNKDDIVFPIPNDNSDKWWLTSIGVTAMTNNNTADTQYQYQRFTMSYLMRGMYSYKNRYLLNASYRRDGSSVFYGVGNTWDNFYSFGAGWVMSEENFMQSQRLIDYLKLKASYGVLGNQNTGTANYYPTYPELVSKGSAIFGDNIIPGYTYQYMVQDLGWEKTHAWEAGFEMTLLDNRLRLEPVFYSKVTKDLIVQLASRTGAQNSMENMGEIRNRGIEISGSWTDKIGNSGFTYSVGGNLTTVNNEVLTLGRDAADAIYAGEKQVARTVKGFPVAYFYGYRVAGIYQNMEDIKQSPENTLVGVAPGDLKFVDISGPNGVPDGKITDADRTMIGNPTPDLMYGLNFNLGYKGFDLGVDMMGVYGNEIFRTWDDHTYAQLNYLDSRMNRWHGEGTSNWEPIVDASRAVNKMNSDYFIEDGSFFRIRNVQLGYTFSQELLQKIYVKSLRIYGNIQNLKTWRRNSGFTPEIGGSATDFGIDKGTYPVPAIYTLGLNLTF